jgi:phage regulator Rha-like protein
MSKQIKLNETATMTSLEIAELTGKEHYDTIKEIRKLIAYYEVSHGTRPVTNGVNCPDITKSTYKDTQNKSRVMFILDQDATLDLVMGYSRELRIKVRTRMRELEKVVKSASESNMDKRVKKELRRIAGKGYLSMLQLTSEEYKPQNKSNGGDEANMIYLALFGCTSKEYKAQRGMTESDRIRKRCSKNELELLDELQKANKSLYEMGFVNFNERLELLTKKANFIKSGWDEESYSLLLGSDHIPDSETKRSFDAKQLGLKYGSSER